MKTIQALVKETTDKIEKEWQPLSPDEKWIVSMAVHRAVELARISQEEKTEKTGVK